MAKIKREDILIVKKHSNWSEASIEKVLKREVYHNRAAWVQFLRLFLLTLGVGFATAGVIFFFAYNWAELPKFVKLGLVELGVVALTIAVLLPKISPDIRNILLTVASVLVGVLFAVFGQIYQTGANAYDFFLGWTVFIILWVAVSNFAPLWLVFVVLVNTTLTLYEQQVAHDCERDNA